MGCSSCSSTKILDSLLDSQKCLEELAITELTEQLGIPVKIYYPRDTQHYSGRHDDIEYPEEPDEVTRILIPQLFDMSVDPRSGINDNLFLDEFIWYCSPDKLVPYLSKVTAFSPRLGNISFLVKDQDAMNVFTNVLWKEIKLVPFVSYEVTDPEYNEMDDSLKDEYLTQKDMMNEFTEDFSESTSVTDEERRKYKYRRLE